MLRVKSISPFAYRDTHNNCVEADDSSRRSSHQTTWTHLCDRDRHLGSDLGEKIPFMCMECRFIIIYKMGGDTILSTIHYVRPYDQSQQPLLCGSSTTFLTQSLHGTGCDLLGPICIIPPRNCHRHDLMKFNS